MKTIFTNKVLIWCIYGIILSLWSNSMRINGFVIPDEVLSRDRTILPDYACHVSCLFHNCSKPAPTDLALLGICPGFERSTCCTPDEVQDLARHLNSEIYPLFSDAQCRNAIREMECGFICSPDQQEVIDAVMLQTFQKVFRLLDTDCQKIFDACSNTLISGELVITKYPTASEFCTQIKKRSTIGGFEISTVVTSNSTTVQPHYPTPYGLSSYTFGINSLTGGLLDYNKYEIQLQNKCENYSLSDEIDTDKLNGTLVYQDGSQTQINFFENTTEDGLFYFYQNITREGYYSYYLEYENQTFSGTPLYLRFFSSDQCPVYNNVSYKVKKKNEKKK